MHELVLKFIDQSEPFAMGFECGILYHTMQQGLPIDGMFHAQNIEQFQNMANVLNYRIEKLNNVGDGWVALKMEPNQFVKED